MSLPRPRRLAVGAVLAMLVTLGGCDLLTSPDRGPVVVTTTASRFSRADTGAVMVPVTIRNESDRPVGVDHCGPRPMVMTQRADGWGFGEADGFSCAAIYSMGPVPLAPGASLSDTVAVRFDGSARFLVIVDGAPAYSPIFRVDVR